jgi:hypothetical protein
VKKLISMARIIHHHVLFSVTMLLFSSGMLNAQANTHTSKAAMEHPGWVQIPGELIRPDCVHEVPNGAKVEFGQNGQATGDVTLNGAVIAHYDACSEAAVSTRHPQSTLAASTKGHGQTPYINGWVEASQWDVSLKSGDNVDLMDGLWYVPSNPSENGGLIYLFNGIEPTTENWILQPVLQYGVGYAGGGNYWAIASWLVGPNYVFHGPLETVSPGNLIFGYTEMTGASGSTHDWRVEAYDETTGANSWITIGFSGLQWNWAFSGVLEAYDIGSCSQLPSSDYAYFEDSSVYHGFPSYDYISPQGWYGAIYQTGGLKCGFGVYAGNTTVLYF